MLLVAAHEADDAPAGRMFDDRLETFAHQLLELHPLLDDGRAAPTFEQRLLDAREPPAQNADHEIVRVVGLRSGWTPAVELLQERNHPV